MYPLKSAIGLFPLFSSYIQLILQMLDKDRFRIRFYNTVVQCACTTVGTKLEKLRISEKIVIYLSREPDETMNPKEIVKQFLFLVLILELLGLTLAGGGNWSACFSHAQIAL